MLRKSSWQSKGGRKERREGGRKECGLKDQKKITNSQQTTVLGKENGREKIKKYEKVSQN